MFNSILCSGLVVSHKKQKSSQSQSFPSSTQHATLSVAVPTSFVKNALLLGQDFQAGESGVDSVKSQEERALDFICGGDGVGVCSRAWVEGWSDKCAADGV